MRRGDDGYIVVETVGAFIPFVLLVVAILSLVNIVALQARIHNAMTQTAGALSMYSYVLEAAGVSDEIMAMDERAGKFSDTVDGVLAGINALSGGGGGVSEVEGMFDALDEAAGDPKDMIQNLANYGLNGLRKEVCAMMAQPLFRRYLTNGKMTAREYFDRTRVVSFEFTDCVIVDKDENVKLTAEYEVEYTFGVLRLPYTPTIHISQTVVTKAWLGGSGKGYQK